MRVVDAADLLVGRLCPYVAGGIGVGSLYWTCVTFGAVTVMQVGATTNKTRVLLNNLQAISDMLDSLWKSGADTMVTGTTVLLAAILVSVDSRNICLLLNITGIH